MKARIAEARQILDERLKSCGAEECPGQLERMKSLLDYIEGLREDF